MAEVANGARKSGHSLRQRVLDKLIERLSPPHPENEPGYVLCEANPDVADLLPAFRFFAVLGAWMEEDVIESTVRNAFAQGVERVFLIDNASSDATVERAVAAGATLVESYWTEAHQEELRSVLMNAVVARESIAAGDDHVWWLWLDADEFPEGPDGLTIVEYLGTLDRRFRLVGSTYYNHYPTTKPENVPGIHPADLQPMCERIKYPVWCTQLHFKHPLQRFDRQGVFLRANNGFHTATARTGAHQLEPQGGIVTHHFPFREEAATRARLELCDSARYFVQQEIGSLTVARRRDSLDAVYSQRWSEIDNRGKWKEELGVTPKRWQGTGARWYDDSSSVEHSR